MSGLLHYMSTMVNTKEQQQAQQQQAEKDDVFNTHHWSNYRIQVG